jgi:lipopolysaccharide/colanic/teichoic acid biosynthesis glycosyltransferase
LQGQALGSAGALKWGQPLLSETFIVLPADVILDLDIEAALTHHQTHNGVVTIIERHHARRAGDVNGNGSITSSRTSATGAYIFESQVLELIPQRTPFDIQEQLLPAIKAAGLSINRYEMFDYVNLMRTFGDYYEAQETLLERHRASETTDAGGNGLPRFRFMAVNGRRFGEGVWVGRNQAIHPEARLRPPVYIGDNSYIGRDVELGPNAVIGSNVVVDDEATVVDSAVLDGTYIGQLVNVERRLVSKNLIIDVETADYMHLTDPFLLGQTPQTVIDSGFQRTLDILLALPVILLTTFFSLPIALLLLVTTGKVFETVERKFFRPTATGERQEVTFELLQFNAKGSRGGYNWLGRWLTRLEINRWPQLWNLLKGELTLVGVKALSSDEVGRLNEQWQQARNEQRPGFTGLWYLNTRQNSVLDEYVVADIYYLATRNWREDLRILWLTPSCWLKRIRH